MQSCATRYPYPASPSQLRLQSGLHLPICGPLGVGGREGGSAHPERITPVRYADREGHDEGWLQKYRYFFHVVQSLFGVQWVFSRTHSRIQGGNGARIPL